MSRRSGQSGYIEIKGNAYYVRFRLDIPGQEARLNKAVRICPVDGPGKLNKFEVKRRAKEIIEEHGANSEEVFRKAEAANLGTTFQQQAERWLEAVQARKRKPIKPRTAAAWDGYLSWINEQIGDVPLSSVNNIAAKDLVARMAAETKNGRPRFSAKSISNYMQVVKMVVASAVNDKGEEIYPVKWNHHFIDLPEVKDQRTPTFTAEEISTILSKAEGQGRLLYAVLAGTGLRVGEALALQVEDVQDSVIQVRHSLWNGDLYSPKTSNGLREVDLHSSLADLLNKHLGQRKSGFVFQSSAGTALHTSNLLRRSLHPILKEMGRERCGFHSFRRYRVTHLRKQCVPEDLLRFWIGHANQSVTDGYSKLKEDVEFRKFTAEQAGLGFSLPTTESRVAPIAPKHSRDEVAISA